MIPYLQREEKRYLLDRPRKPVLLIVGDGANVFDDLENFWSYETDHDTGCINNIARVFPCDFEHFFAGDSHEGDMQQIAVSLNHTDVLTHCYNPMSEPFAVRWFKENWGWHGTSSMFAIYVAICLGYLRIVLAGCPMNDIGRWYEGQDRVLYDHALHLWRWKQFRERPWAHFVRSMSGKTSDILGVPSMSWLKQPDKILPFTNAGLWLAQPIETIKNLPGRA
jgi:hypothetical protein